MHDTDTFACMSCGRPPTTKHGCSSDDLCGAGRAPGCFDCDEACRLEAVRFARTERWRRMMGALRVD